MKAVSIPDEVVKHLICVILTEVKKNPEIQKNAYLMVLISVLQSIFEC